MLVAVTGATGFVGSHTVAALVEAGHSPRILVRDPAKAARVLGALGLDSDAVDTVIGDLTNRGAIDELLEGAAALIHCAAAVHVTGPPGALTGINVDGTRAVVGRAVELGLDPAVYVSSVAIFVPPSGPVISSDSPLADPRTEYGRSKVEAERLVRSLQDDGAPITVVYPGGVMGPGQPTLDAAMEGLAGALSRAWPMTTGGVALIDVRDLAAALAATVAPAKGPRRLMLGGHYISWPDYAELCDDLTGTRCRRVTMPAAALRALGATLDLAKRVRPFHYPLTRDAAEIMATMVPTDDGPTLDLLGVRLRPLRETIEDSISVLAESGDLPARAAGRLATDPPPEAPRGFVSMGGPIGRATQAMASSSWFAKYAPSVVPRLDRAVHRLTRGRVIMSRLLVPSLVLTTIGRRSGEQRRAPLACLPEEGGSFLVVGSNFGRERHPAWTANLLHNPAASVSFAGRDTSVRATLLEGKDRADVWPKLTAMWPVYDRYEDGTERLLRVFRLAPN